MSDERAGFAPSVWEKWFAIGVQVAGLIVLAVVVVALVAFVIDRWNDEPIRKIVTEHLQAVVGLPVAGAFAFLVVALFRSTEGRIQFEVPGFKFEGASGPIIMWVICFLAIAGSIKMVWG